MQVNDMIRGFQVIRVRENEELGGKLWELRHNATGAKLAWLDNGANNKLFSIGFKTIPWDHTGVFHILEHSVLNGSKKYPVKEPFVNLLKSSMNTFLNAMTFPDKTIFPVSSRNEQDYLNLTSVYLDAVFCPAIYENPNIFYQEGWHYELTEENAQPTYNGVVFNEMKGALSSPDSLMFDGISRLLFPDSCYGCESGGDPVHIPELTYEAFIGAHREFYHPGNAYVYLDGDVPFEKVLTMLDSYFSAYDYPCQDHNIELQSDLPYVEKTEYYEGGADATAQLITGQRMGTWQDRKTLMALSALCDYLTGSNEAPLKKAILSSGIAREANMFVEDSIAQPFVGLMVKQLDAARKDELLALIRDTLANHVIDKADLLATIDHLEFSTRDVREPAGLMKNIMGLNTWLHGGDVLEGMVFNPIFQALRQDLECFDTLLKEITFSGDNAATLCLLPSSTKGQEDQEAEQARLAAASADWTPQDRKDILALNENLKQWQNTPDTPEKLKTLPMLPLSQISTEIAHIPTQIKALWGRPLLEHKTVSHEISHFQLYFSLADLSADQLQQLSLLTRLLGQLPTARYSATELELLKKSTIGNLDFGVNVYADRQNDTQCRPYFMVTFSCLTQKEEAAMALIQEILLQTQYQGSDSQTLIRIILAQSKEELSQRIMAAGNRYASTRAASHFSAASALGEALDGFDFFQYLKALDGSFDEKALQLQEDLAALTASIFCTSRLTASSASAEESKYLSGLIAQLPAGSFDGSEILTLIPDGKPCKEAILIPAPVSYAAACGKISSYDGSMNALANILNFDYLWNEIRVKGGAYGCGFRAASTGNVAFSSYRDPSPVASIATFGCAGDFLRRFCQEAPALDQYIIGAAASQEPLLSEAQMARVANSNYFSGISNEDESLWRKELLEMTGDNLLEQAARLDGIDYAACIIGSKNAFPEEEKASWTVFEL